jgi:cephalosporin hydroxylase
MSIREVIKSSLSPEGRREVRKVVNAVKWPAVKALGLWRRRGYEAQLPFTGGRSWTSAIPFDLHHTIQAGTIDYTYRDVPCLKHPMDFALYALLVWNTKPRSIIEIGSKAGGSALWFSDLQRTYGIDGHILSIDITPPVPTYQRPEIRFLRGDANNLGESVSEELLESLPRPWLVVEDASHHYAATLAVLQFFGPRMRFGEYIVVEDGNVSDMGDDLARAGGPLRAVSQYLLETPGRFEIVSSYCDRYGHNVTGNPNGYLRCIAD